MYFFTLNNICMGAKALALKDKEFLRAKALQAKIPFCQISSEINHTYVFFTLNNICMGVKALALKDKEFLRVKALQVKIPFC